MTIETDFVEAKNALDSLLEGWDGFVLELSPDTLTSIGKIMEPNVVEVVEMPVRKSAD